MIDGNQRSTESTIRTELFHNHGYERRSRSTFSALNYGSTFQSLSLILKLIYIHDYSQDTNVLKTIGLLELTWIDELLRWNKSNYDNIDQIRIRLNEVYHPDIMLQNSVDNRNLLDKGEDWHNSDLFLYSTGMVYCLPLITMETICEPIDDKQEIINCPFMFVSWMIDINHFNLTSTDLLQNNSKVKQYLLESNPPFLIINSSIELRIDPLLDNPQLIYHFRLRRLTNLNVKSSIMLVVDCIIIINCFSIFLLRLEKKSRSIIQNLTMISLVIILVYLGIVNNAHKIVIYVSKIIVLVSVIILWSSSIENGRLIKLISNYRKENVNNNNNVDQLTRDTNDGKQDRWIKIIDFINGFLFSLFAFWLHP